jgi:molybdopterin synthase catalytic subunit
METTTFIVPAGSPVAVLRVRVRNGDIYKPRRPVAVDMKALGVVGPGAGTATLIDRLADRLADRGSVGVVGRLDGVPDADDVPDDDGALVDGPPAAETTYELADDGGWVAAGGDASLDDVLADLAPGHDYALVGGFADSRLPKVVLGGRDHGGESLVAASDADAVDVDAVVDRLADTEPYETLESLVAAVERAPGAERAGAVATFTGRVRAKDHPDDEPTEYLEFEKYEGVADRQLATIREELEARDGVQAVRLHHRTGVVQYGEDIVFVVVLASHREEAFRTVEDGIDRLKDEVPLFKKEVTVDEAFWVHERA